MFHFSFSSFNCISEEETEDDEVSEAVLKTKPTVVPETLVPALTDKTFDAVKKENDLLVVDFFQPCKLLRQIMKLYLYSDLTSCVVICRIEMQSIEGSIVCLTIKSLLLKTNHSKRTNMFCKMTCGLLT